MKTPREITRRNAVKTLAAGATIASAGAPSLFAKGANDRIIVGAIGMGGRGRVHSNKMAARDDVEVAFAADFGPSAAVPELSTVILLGTGLLGLGFVAWRRKEEED